MTELKKTIYVSEEQSQTIMEKSLESFTKRITHMALVGIKAEDVLKKAEDEFLCFDSNEELINRVADLMNKGLLYEQEKEPKIDFTKALGFFNTMYKKKYPNKSLPCA